jgi:transglutaminase-like putative cysteine protease
LTPDAVQVSSPSEAMESFNPNRKVLTGVVPGVEVGSVVEYAYEFDQYDPEDPRLFFPGYYFQGTEPVVLSRVKVQVPEDAKFNYVTRNFAEQTNRDPVVERRDGVVSYTWTVEDSPPLVQEPAMPPMRDVVPMMEGSVFESFEDVYALQRDLQSARIALTPEIRAKVEELTADAATVDDKLARIYHWVQANTRYISIKGSLGAGWSGHTAQETFENRYGDCTDKAVLFASMCDAIGVTSYPIILLTNTEGTGITEIPTMDANHCISEVVLEDGRSFYLDSTAQNFRYPYFRPDDHGGFALNAIRGDIKRIPVPPPSDNRRFSHLDVTLQPNGDVAVRTMNRYTGSIEAGIRGFWKQVREDNRALRMSEYVNSISPGAILEDFTLSDLGDLNKQLSMAINYQLPGHAIRSKDLMYLRVPTLERTFPEAALETRRFPIQYMTTEERILEVDIALPDQFRIKWMPPPLKITSPYLEYSGGYEESDGIIQFRQMFRRLKRIVPVEDYAEYRDHLRAIAAFTKNEIFVTEES